MQDLKALISNLQSFAQKRFGFERPPKLFLKQDMENAKNAFGKTAYYDPQEESITLFISARHPKDILRSYAHELVHHTQNLRGDLSPEKCGEMGLGYAQNNPHMREMEREAYERGNMCFRDWEDNYKSQININLKESKKMAIKISKNELKELIGKLLKERKENIEEAPYEAGPAPRLQSRYVMSPDQAAAKDAENMMASAAAMGKADVADASSREVAKKAASQKRNLRRIGLKSIAQLQAKVGAEQTGEYDAQTMAAVQKLQRKLGVKDDGIFGRGTARALRAKKQGGMMAKSKGGLTPDRAMTKRSFSGSDDTTLGDEEGLVRQMDASDKDIAAIKQNIKKDKSRTSNQAELDALAAAAGERMPDRSLKMMGLSDEEVEDEFVSQPGPPNEGKIITPEQEEKLFESRFGKRNEDIFNKLKKLWTKQG